MVQNQKRLAEFQPLRLRQARRGCKMSMATLAERIGVTRQAVSAYESGANAPASDVLRRLAAELGVQAAFFTAPLYDSENQRQSVINFRSLRASTLRAREQAKTYMEWTAGLTSFLSKYVVLPAAHLPTFEIPDFGQLDDVKIEELAEETRRFFGLGDGPISDLTLLLENKGVTVGYVPLETGMDGLSGWFARCPYILINSTAFHARARYDLAHELAHLVIHRGLTDEEFCQRGVLNLVEDQANKFAAAFLLPAKTFVPEVYSVDMESLISLKRRWGVSVQAIIMRLNSLQLISDQQKMRLFKFIGMRGMRRKEPLDGEIPREKSRLFVRVATLLDENKTLFREEFAIRTMLPVDFIKKLADIPEPERDSHLASGSNVINFTTVAAGRNKPQN
jgi:Zn-dependent peptidase ImmA (M78 family)/transcriptional regulator with XRE-family HTH domain